MDLARDLVGLGRAAREQVKIKVRQPLHEILPMANTKNCSAVG